MAYTPILPARGVTGYAYLTRTRSDQQALFAAAPEMQRDLAAFTDQIRSVKTSEDLLDNYQLLKVALGAFGLDEDIGNRGFLKAVLDSDTASEDSFVNRLADKRYLEFAQAFNFAGTGGPQLDELKSVDAVKAQVLALESAEDLLEDRTLLRAALETFGLTDVIDNTHFLGLVLNSDPDDPSAFANTLSDPRYAEFAASFGFGARARSDQNLFGLAEALAGAGEALTNPDALLAEPDLLSRMAALYGISDAGTNEDFWGQVLTSDPADAEAFVNQLSDPRYAALSRAFGFGDPFRIAAAEAARGADLDAPLVFEVSPLISRFTEALSDRSGAYEDAGDFLSDFDAMLATFDLLDLPRTDRGIPYAGRVLASDPNDETGLLALEPDPRYAALQTALDFQPEVTEHSYPDGFAEAIAQRYVDLQFEIAVGNQDQSMRVALAFERDLTDVAENGTTLNGRWYSIMSSGVLRDVFETVFGLPESFGTLDIDQQLTVFKQRSERLFGTDDPAQLTTADRLEEIRSSYLLQSEAALSQNTSSAATVLALLAS